MATKYKTKKYLIKTFGCQANVADSNTMAGILEALGFESTTSVKDSDVFIVNTCSVRQKSEDKVYGIGKLFKSLKNEEGDSELTVRTKKPFTIMAGCMVGSVTGDRQRYAFEELKTRTPWVDEYINPSQVTTIPQLLQKSGILDEWAVQKFDPQNAVAVQDNPTHVFVNISYGCDNFCTFCVVPYARGPEVSRSEADILKEINHLAQRGFTEVTLCGQNVNSWGLNMTEKFEIRTGDDKKIPFADLLRKVHEIEGIEKIGFISSNPFDFTNDLIEAIKLPKISNYLHIAVQSGNNDILKKMNRRHTVEDFISLSKALKKAKPNLELGTDIIVGFPSETEEQFMDTVELFKKIKFNVAFISIYSPRKGTPAEKFFKDDVPLKEKKRRHAVLTEVWKETKLRK
jgi:tRNA-2-methylthio-N6-dimethylallyladenosine synthase